MAGGNKKFMRKFKIKFAIAFFAFLIGIASCGIYYQLQGVYKVWYRNHYVKTPCTIRPIEASDNLSKAIRYCPNSVIVECH